MDKLLNKNTFKHINKVLNENEYKNLRILSVSGGYGLDRSMIYVTQDDEVYGMGDNSEGCLGVDSTDRFVFWPKLNTTLTNRQLVDINNGFNHCLGLTRDGLLYSWGSNKWGQLGVGFQPEISPKPLLIERLSDKRVVQISCGNAFNLALTESGEVYGWGKNPMGQVGNWSFKDSYWPSTVPLCNKAEAISCGKTHALALVSDGFVYIWGNNNFGQLGQKQKFNTKKGLIFSSNRPLLLQSMAIYKITKAVCGPNSALLLTSVGDIYSFGLNDCGQVGNGTLRDQCLPVRVNGRIKFKDIFATYKCHICIALSIDNKYYYWGLCKEQKIMRPQLVPNVFRQSLNEIFTNCSEYKITYKAIVNINEDNSLLDQTISPIEDNKTDNLFSDKDMDLNDLKTCNSANNSSIVAKQTTNECEISKTIPKSLTPMQTLNTESNDLSNNSCEPFANSAENVIPFRINDRYVYGHKEFFRVRNKKFWLKCMQYLNEENTEILVKHYTYKTFYAFIQYLYTNTIDIDDQNVNDLLKLADNYSEEELKHKCLKLLDTNN